MITDFREVKKSNLASSELTNVFSTFLNVAIKMTLTHSDIAKIEVFAEMVNISPNVLTNIINRRTAPDYDQWLNIINALRELSPNYGYKWFCEQVLGDWIYNDTKTLGDK